MIDTNAIKFVYFDLDDTLLDHAQAEKKALIDLHANADFPLNEHLFETVLKAYRRINPTVWQKYSAGEYSKTEAKVGRFELLLNCLNSDSASSVQPIFPNNAAQQPAFASSPQAIELADAYLDRYSNYWKAVPGAMEAFLNISESLSVGVLTNGFSEIQLAKLRQFPDLQDRSEAIVISEEVGVLKPHPRLFEHAAALVSHQPEDILYVGDSLNSDVKGGIGAGWKVAWYSEDEYDHEDVMSFTDWSEFSSWLCG